MKYKKEFKQFINEMKEGIVVGQKKYGNEGLFGDSQLEQMKEEARDLANYSFLFWLKINMLQKGLVKKEDLKELTGKQSKNKFKKYAN
jgi:hypothetical protein